MRKLRNMHGKTNKKIWGGVVIEDDFEDDSSNEIYKEPSFIETVSNRIYFYSDIDRDRILQLNKEIRDLSNDSLYRAIERDVPAEHMYLHINSFGGSVFDGFAGVDEILKSKTPVYTIIDGACASAATFLSIVGQKRFINKHAHMLIHQLSNGMWGKYAEFQDEMKNMDNLMIMIKKLYKEHTTLPMSKLDEILKHDIWFSPEDCLKYGLVDEIL